MNGLTVTACSLYAGSTCTGVEYRMSDGRVFECASCSDCTDAATDYAQACNGSGGSGGVGCSELADCCDELAGINPSTASSCDAAVSQGYDSTCASYLQAYRQGGYCR